MKRRHAVAIVIASSVIAVAYAAPSDGAQSATSHQRATWKRLVAVHDVGLVDHACRGGGSRPFQGLTRFTATNATLRARYLTSKGATDTRTLQPGQGLTAPGVGRRGDVRWLIVQPTKPQTIRLRVVIDYTGLSGGCYHVPLTELRRRSVTN